MTALAIAEQTLERRLLRSRKALEALFQKERKCIYLRNAEFAEAYHVKRCELQAQHLSELSTLERVRGWLRGGAK